MRIDATSQILDSARLLRSRPAGPRPRVVGAELNTSTPAVPEEPDVTDPTRPGKGKKVGHQPDVKLKVKIKDHPHGTRIQVKMKVRGEHHPRMHPINFKGDLNEEAVSDLVGTLREGLEQIASGGAASLQGDAVEALLAQFEAALSEPVRGDGLDAIDGHDVAGRIESALHEFAAALESLLRGESIPLPAAPEPDAPAEPVLYAPKDDASASPEAPVKTIDAVVHTGTNVNLLA